MQKHRARVRRLLWLACLILTLGLATSASAQMMMDTPPIKTIPLPTLDVYPAGGAWPAILLIRLAPGVELMAPGHPKAEPETMKLALDPGQAATLQKTEIKGAASDHVCRNMAVILATLAIPADQKPGPLEVKATLHADFFSPTGRPARKTLPVSIPLNIVAPDVAPRVASQAMLDKLGLTLNLTQPTPAAAPPAMAGSEAAAAPAAPAGPNDANGVVTGGGGADDLFADRSVLYIFILVFLGGMALNLTPCVYPLIPITVSLFGGMNQEIRRTSALANALAYWAGMTITYSILGSMVALSGAMLGEALTSPVVLLIIVGVLVAMAASMFGLWEIRVPAVLNRIAGKNYAGAFGALVMGALVGILAAPCVGPFVVGLMTHVAQKGSVPYGFFTFFLLAAGLGLPLAVLALFSEKLTNKLPQAGGWMLWVRAFFGMVLLAMAIGTARPLLGFDLWRWGVTILGVVGGIWLGFFHKAGDGRFVAFKRVFGIVILATAGSFFIYTTPAKLQAVNWLNFEPQIVKAHLGQGKPLAVLFTADWCPPCRQLKATTFPDARVAGLMNEKFFPIKVDVTKGPGQAQGLLERLGVRGVPTVAFLTPQGKYLRQYTLVGFEPPEEFMARLDKVMIEAGVK
ncbi:MAG: thioredoxin fold domain-containing protein [Deltaproteobacteria bacterium]|nr:thioredoxin fold domain-containing protein [Deltaproteobacteria bacterium]